VLADSLWVIPLPVSGQGLVKTQLPNLDAAISNLARCHGKLSVRWLSGLGSMHTRCHDLAARTHMIR